MSSFLEKTMPEKFETKFEEADNKGLDKESQKRDKDIDKKEEYLVLKDKEIREVYKDGLLQNLKIIGGLERGINRCVKKDEHEPIIERSPAAVIFTEAGAVPFGYALKEAFKEAFPNKTLPKFLRINVKPFKYEFSRLKRKIVGFGGMVDLLEYEDNKNKNGVYGSLFSEVDDKEYRQARVAFNKAVEQWKDKIEKFKLQDEKLALFDEVMRFGDTRDAAVYLLLRSGIARENIIELFGVTPGGDRPVWRGREDEIRGRGPTEQRQNREVRIVRGKDKIQQVRNLKHDMELLGREIGRILRDSQSQEAQQE